MRPLNKVFWDETSEMLHIEEMLSKSLLRMSAAASTPIVREAMEAYRATSQTQCQQVRDLFQLFELPAREKKCDGMMGILMKGQQLMQRTGSGPALDAALVSLCRKVAGYKATSYASLLSWAKLILKEEPALVALKTLVRSEIEAGLQFERLAPQCDQDAANQIVDSVRRVSGTAVKRVKAFADAPRWGE
jgi:ferritin-like metal-binding protein YciE